MVNRSGLPKRPAKSFLQPTESKHMAGPFNDDPNRRPDLPRSPWWDWDDIRNRDWTPPTLPMPPSSGPRLPWWVDPRLLPTGPNLTPTPSLPPQPTPSQVPMSLINPSEAAPNQPLPHYGQNGHGQYGPIDSAPTAGPVSGATPAEIPGGLLGMLYAMIQQSEPKQDAGPNSSPLGASQQATPEWRLGRRTYRA